jgi:hypothetical protein
MQNKLSYSTYVVTYNLEPNAGCEITAGQNRHWSGQIGNKTRSVQTNCLTSEVKNIPCLLCLIILNRIYTFTAQYHLENAEQTKTVYSLTCHFESFSWSTSCYVNVLDTLPERPLDIAYRILCIFAKCVLNEKMFVFIHLWNVLNVVEKTLNIAA